MSEGRAAMDLFTVEVVQKLLLAAAEEMGITLVRTAYSPNIKERRDASAAVFDAEGHVIAQAAHIPMHLSSMMELPRVLAEAYPPASWRPGDMFVANDPYAGAGSHLNDIAVIAPVFVGGRVIAFVANTAHHADVGGRVPGSESGDSTSIFQDGLRLPVARIVSRGRIEDGLLRTILLNSRTPQERIGDLKAQLAANRAGGQRLTEIHAQYGPDLLGESMREILDYTERRTRQGIAAMPDGVYESEGFCDDDGLTDRPVRIRVAVTVRGDRIALDFSGTDSQIQGAKNVPTVSLLATVYYVLKAVIDPDIPPNAGYYRAITVHVPPGTVLNPLPPAAVAARFTTCQKVADVILSAFARSVPERVVAHCHGGTLAIYSGTNPRTGEFFVDYEVYAGGSGARATKDGMDGIANHTTNTSNLPIEALETEFPLVVERYELQPDSGGPGRFRGGLAIVREVRGLDGDLTVGGWGCDHRIPAQGLFGGGAGVPGGFHVVDPEGRVETTVRSTVPGLRLSVGRRLRIVTSGGGGFGDPFERDPALVARDLAAGKVSPGAAEAAYGVVLRAGEVDLDATRRLRAERRESFPRSVSMATKPVERETTTSESLLDRARKLLMRTSGGEFLLPVIERAEGATITDVDGKAYLDFASGQMCATLGHSHPRIVDAIKRSVARVMHLYSGMVSPEVVGLAERLVDLLPAPLRKVFFLSTGGESTEAAIKIAKNASGKYEVVSLADSFHGSTWGAASSTFIQSRRAGYGPTVPGTYVIPAPNCYRCPLDLAFPSCDYACARVGFDLVDKQTTGSLAALIAEPIQGAAGMVEPPPGYLGVLQRLCRERDMLFVLDEAQTGLGRVGQMWGFEADGAVPDIVAVSKTLGGGIPLAAVATSPAIEEQAYRNGFWFYTSHLNEPLPSAVGVAVIDAIREEKLVEAAREKGAYLKNGFLRLKERHEIIGDVRGRGLLMGIDFVRDRVSKKPAEAEAETITRLCLERGLFMSPIRQRGRYFVWRVAPPLTISYAEMDRSLEIVEQAIRAVTG